MTESKKPTLKNYPVKATVGGAIEHAQAVAEDLQSEFDDAVSNMEEKFSGTERYQHYEDARDALESIDWDSLSVPEYLRDQVEWTENRRKSAGKADRMQNVVNALRAAEEGVAKYRADLPDMDLPEDEEADRESELESLESSIAEAADAIEGVIF